MRNLNILHLIHDKKFRDVLFRTGFFVNDYKLDLLSVSKWLRDFGFSTADIKNGIFQNNIHPDDFGTYDSLWKRVLEGREEEFYCEYRIRDKNGDWRWLQTQALVVDRSAEGIVQQLVGIDRCIDSRKKAEGFLQEQLLETKKQYDIAESLRVAGTIVTSDLELTKSLTIALEQMRFVVEFDCAEVFAREGDHFNRITTFPEDSTFTLPDPKPLQDELLDCLYPVIKDKVGMSSPFPTWLGIPLRVKNKTVGMVFLWHHTDGFFKGSDLYPVMAFGDSLAVAINNGQKFLKTVADLESDGLTGFLTRKSFDRSSEAFWSDYKESYNAVAVVMIDLDKFKSVNDEFGHDVGDIVIREVASLCNSILRKGDILGRYGGEEFIAIMPGIDKKGAAKTMERIRSSCEQLDIDEINRPVTVSIGIAISNSSEDLLQVIKRADKALYQAKDSGRNKVEFA